MSSSPSGPGGRRSSVRTAKPRTASGAIGGLIGAFVMSIIAGVLLTVAVTPVVAISGFAATSAISIFENLPNHLDPGRLAEPSTLYAKDAEGKSVELASFYAQNREMIDWDSISQYVKDAAIAVEDPRFYTHSGVDVISLSRATLGQLAGTSQSGASTITMQYVRNVLVQRAEAIIDEQEREEAYNDAMRQDVDRKLQEIRYAVSIEKKYSKDEILLGYLNIALFGNNIYGIESAAQSYYGKSAKDLTLSEAASLIAIVQFPSNLHLADEANIAENQVRRNYVLQRMLDAQRITQDEYDAAVATDVVPNLTPRPSGCTEAETKYGLGHFCDYVQRTIEMDTSFGATPEERHFNFLRGGFQIMTTIDLDMQKTAIETLRGQVPATMEGINIGAAVSSVQVGTGRVLTMAQNRPFNADPEFIASNPGFTAINYNTDFEYGGSNGFQVGSTMKAFTLAEWLRAGNSLYDSVNGNGRTVNDSSFRAHCLGGIYGSNSWSFRNDAGERPGNATVMHGTAISLNGVFVSMQQRLDLCDTVQLAQDLGVHRASEQTIDGLSNTGTSDLTINPATAFAGTDEIAPLTMANAYAAFANGGTVCTPIPIDSITDSEGVEVPFTKSECTEGIPSDVAAGVLYALQGVVGNGTATHARSPIGVPHFAKSGTTDNAVDRWNIGGSTTVSTAVWVGNVEGFVSLNSTGLGRVERPIFTNVLAAGDYKYGGGAFPDPPRSATIRVMVPIPSVEGRTYSEAEQLLTSAGFGVVSGGDVDSSVEAGRIASSSPAGEASRGSDVTLYTSRGNLGAVPDDLVGSSSSAAEASLRSAGFSNIRQECISEGGDDEDDDSRGRERVDSVEPASGTEVKSDSRVTLFVRCS